jgi:hypothetical protein
MIDMGTGGQRRNQAGVARSMPQTGLHGLGHPIDHLPIAYFAEDRLFGIIHVVPGYRFDPIYRIREGQVNDIATQAIASRPIFIAAAGRGIIAQLPALVQAARKVRQRHRSGPVATEDRDHDRALALLCQLIDPAAAR